MEDGIIGAAMVSCVIGMIVWSDDNVIREPLPVCSVVEQSIDSRIGVGIVKDGLSVKELQPPHTLETESLLLLDGRERCTRLPGDDDRNAYNDLRDV